MRCLARGRMRQALKGLVPAAVIGLGLAAGTPPQPAAAQVFGNWGGDGWAGGWGGGGRWGGLRNGDIVREIAQQGFRVISPLRRKGAVFIADVVDRRGRRERLIVAAADAQILQRYYLDDPRLPGFVPRDALAGRSPDADVDRADRGDTMVPPGDIPNVGRQRGGGQAYQAPDDADQGSGKGGLGRGNDDDPDEGLDPVRRPAPKPVKPKPRVVERTPDTALPPARDGLDPLPGKGAPRKPNEPTLVQPNGQQPDQANDRTVVPPAKVAARPPEPARAPLPPQQAAPSANPTTTTRLRDPLAIPGSEPKPAGKPVDPPRASAAASQPPRVVTPPAPAPVKAPPAPPKTGDVPVAPLD